MSFKAVIIDDERYAREEMRFLLEQFQDIVVVAEVSRGIDCMDVIHEVQPDVIFLDIEMPRRNGIDIAQELQSHNMLDIEIIFTTAYPQFAAEAFRVDALDYLLKPYKEEQLKEAIQKLRMTRTLSEPVSQSDKIKGELRGATHYIPICDIHYVHTKGKMTQMYTLKETFIFNGSMKEAEEKLIQHGFYRTHRSYLINIQSIQSIAPWFNAAHEITLKDFDEKIPLSRNYAKALFSILETE